ncbi:UNVERIFIED_CONTAM: adenosylcobinamide kinase/adenosylcobinamide-phosphate guanylyltransferase [Brevibacillus sp. OAP136]
MSVILITGGVRSGKSRIGEERAAESDKVIYIATGMVTDAEMRDRITQHQIQRPSHWRTLEAPESLVGTIGHFEAEETVLLDSLTTWVSNRLVMVPEEQMRDQGVTDAILGELGAWLEQMKARRQCVIVITDEVGYGGIAMSRLGRWFQDVLGEANQLVASAADEVVAVMSGIPVRIKG